VRCVTPAWWSGKVDGRTEWVWLQLLGFAPDVDSLSVRIATRTGITRTFWHGSDTAQANFFVNTGDDDHADEILGPLGVLPEYRRLLAEFQSAGLLSLFCLTIRNALPDKARLLRLLHEDHRYRWSDPAAVRAAVAAHMRAILTPGS
jgi:hypothetical protein